MAERLGFVVGSWASIQRVLSRMWIITLQQAEVGDSIDSGVSSLVYFVSAEPLDQSA